MASEREIGMVRWQFLRLRGVVPLGVICQAVRARFDQIVFPLVTQVEIRGPDTERIDVHGSLPVAPESVHIQVFPVIL